MRPVTPEELEQTESPSDAVVAKINEALRKEYRRGGRDVLVRVEVPDPWSVVDGYQKAGWQVRWQKPPVSTITAFWFSRGV